MYQDKILTFIKIINKLTLIKLEDKMLRKNISLLGIRCDFLID